MDLRIKKTYKLLTEALIKLLGEKPLSEIKLNEICDLAMVHKTTFYNHFSDKYDLLKYTPFKKKCYQNYLVQKIL